MDNGGNRMASAPEARELKKWIPSLKLTYDDIKSLLILITLYIIQGIPLGLNAVIPLLIHDKVSYTQMACLSCTRLPFCLKLLWAPVVDSVYSKRFGKRKSWLVPVQLTCGALLMYGSVDKRIDAWVGQDASVNTVALTIYFTLLYFLMATQDIVVDAWALTMLRPEMRIHASTCNTAGQAIGINVAFIGFTLLSNKSICLRLYSLGAWFYRASGGHLAPLTEEETSCFKPFATLSDFTWFFGIITVVFTILILFKREDEDLTTFFELPTVTGHRSKERQHTLHSTTKIINKNYLLLREILQLKPTKMLCTLLLSYGFIYAAENPAELKLLETGIPKELYATVTPLGIPLEIIGPPLITMIMHNSSTTEVLYKGMFVRLISMVLYIGLVVMTGIYYSDASHDALAKAFFYVFFLSVSAFRRFCALIVSVSFMSLFAQVADPSIGGVYMALLNTLANLGEVLPRTVGLWLMDFLEHSGGFHNYGLWIELFLCVLSGIVLFPRYRRTLNKISSFEMNEWYVNKMTI